MPIYEFECVACSHRHERLQKLSDPDPLDCPACAAPRLRRRVSAPSFRLAGSGWYETDFKSGKDSKRNLADGGSEAAGDRPVADAPAAQPADATPPAPNPAAGGD